MPQSFGFFISVGLCQPPTFAALFIFIFFSLFKTDYSVFKKINQEKKLLRLLLLKRKNQSQSVRWIGAICRRKNKAYHQLAALGKSKCMTEWNVAKCGVLLEVACSFCESVSGVFCKLFQQKKQCSDGKAKAKTRKAMCWLCNM